MFNSTSLLDINSKYNKFFLLLASLFFSFMTVCVKKIDNRIPISELVFFRSIFSLLITYLIIKKRKVSPWGINKSLLILRGILGTLALLCIFYAIRNMPLSIATIIQYTYPIFISIFSVIFIREKLNKYIIFALFIGWLGIIIILNPNQLSSLDINIKVSSIIISFIGAICTSLAYITVKKLSKGEDIFVIIEYFPLVSTIVLLPIIILNWVPPQTSDFIWIIGIVFFTQLGQTFLTIGLKNLPTTQAATINYCQVFFGSLWGIYFFNEKITINFIIGSILVLLGTLISTSKYHKTIYNKS
tara:strand:- start:1983 stop:2885 length:903 start_codon:yes stop_codon:yes gene_type:complete